MIDKLNDFVLNSFVVGHAHAATRQPLDFFSVFDSSSFLVPQGTARQTFSGVLGFVMSWALAIIAIIAFFYLIMSGVNYITAGGDAAKATTARTGILNAIIGIVVVVLAYFILRFAIGLGNNLVGQ